jgi:hypothetical protein
MTTDTLQSADTVEDVVQKTLQEVVLFVTDERFLPIITEIYSLPEADRHGFVETVLLNHEELRNRGVLPPNDIIIQRSAFSDGRPTLFCVAKLVPQGYGWKKVTVTFDNP